MKLKILFIGGTPRGLELLKSLIAENKKVVYACIMKEDDHEIVKASHMIKQLCLKHGIPLEICKAVGNAQIKRILQSHPDVGFVCGWRTILPPGLTGKIPFGCITAHDSLLPKYRGFAPLNWAIINGEKRTGVTIFRIGDGKVDSGIIFGQKTVKIGACETAAEVYPRIISATIALYKEFIPALEKGKLRGRRQDESRATYTCKRTPQDGRIDWNMPAQKIFDLIRAISLPYPCAWTEYKGEKIRISEAALPRKHLRYAGNIPGRIVEIREDGVLALCGQGQLIIKKIITSSNKHLDAGRFFTSIKTTLGSQGGI